MLGIDEHTTPVHTTVLILLALLPDYKSIPGLDLIKPQETKGVRYYNIWLYWKHGLNVILSMTLE